MLGLWILANAAGAQQIVSTALFHDLREILDADAGTDFFPVGWIRGSDVRLAEKVYVAGERTLWARLPGEGLAYDRTRSPRATPPGTPPRSSKKRRKKR